MRGASDVWPFKLASFVKLCQVTSSWSYNSKTRSFFITNHHPNCCGAVAKWQRSGLSNQKVVGSIPAAVHFRATVPKFGRSSSCLPTVLRVENIETEISEGCYQHTLGPHHYFASFDMHQRAAGATRC